MRIEGEAVDTTTARGLVGIPPTVCTVGFELNRGGMGVCVMETVMGSRVFHYEHRSHGCSLSSLANQVAQQQQKRKKRERGGGRIYSGFYSLLVHIPF
jgi:hypothetical protein